MQHEHVFKFKMQRFYRSKYSFNTIRIYLENRHLLKEVEVWKLFTAPADYITYEGSLTSPGCYETVIWVVINQPISIAEADVMITFNIE